MVKTVLSIKIFRYEYDSLLITFSYITVHCNGLFTLCDRYMEGTLKAQSEDTEAAQLVEQATAGLLTPVSKETEGALDWELDELLCWTNSLNYDE